MLPTEHESRYFDFCNPSNVKRTILAGILPWIFRIFPDFPRFGGNETCAAALDRPTTRAGGQDDVSYNKLPQIKFDVFLFD